MSLCVSLKSKCAWERMRWRKFVSMRVHADERVHRRACVCVQASVCECIYEHSCACACMLTRVCVPECVRGCMHIMKAFNSSFTIFFLDRGLKLLHPARS